MKTIAYHSTIGLNVFVPQLSKRALIKIAHDKQENGNWKVYVESGHNLNVIKKCGTKIIKNEEIRELFNDDDVIEFNNLAGLFGIAI